MSALQMEDEDLATSHVPIRLEHFTAAALLVTFFLVTTALVSIPILFLKLYVFGFVII